MSVSVTPTATTGAPAAPVVFKPSEEVISIRNEYLAQLLIGVAMLCIAFATLVLKIIEVARKGK